MQIKAEKQLMQKLNQYEKHGMDFYTDASAKGFTSESRLMPDGTERKADSSILVDPVTEENPYQTMMRWITTEVQELVAMKECIGSIQKIEEKLKDLREKLTDDREFYMAQ